MINFYTWLNEISATSSKYELPSYSSRGSSKLNPDAEKFNIIPVEISFDAYNLLIGHCDKSNCQSILDRRGNGQESTVFVSNEELYDLKKLIINIINSSNNSFDSKVAKETLEKLNSGF
jgi:hypothetical protein